MSRVARDTTLLVVLWAAVTVPFLGKAFHIDDPVHVLQAEHIAAHPTRPLELEIFWFEWPEWLADSNPVTPPVWQYELAGAVVMAGGAGEVALNLLAALHLLLLALSVYHLATWVLDWPLLATAFVLVSPAAIVGRNVMLDVPMMSYLVAGLAAVVAGSERGRSGLLVLGLLLVGVASVTKLPGLLGVPAVAGYLLLAGRRRQLPLVGIALVPLCLWYAYQFYATGGVDILRPRGGGGFVPEHSVAASLEIAAEHVVFWGGAMFTGHAFLAALLSSSRAWPLGFVPLVALAALAILPFDPGGGVAWVLTAAFCAGGAGLAWGAASGARRLWAAGGLDRRICGLTGLWCIVQIGFDVAGLWEMNVRFAFLSAVPAALLCSTEIERLGTRAPSRWRYGQTATLVLGAIVSLLVAWSDSEWAAGYRRIAAEIAARHPGERAWFVGHWGFQHYATAKGLVPYSPRDDEISPGNLLIVPLNAARQSVPDQVMDRVTVLERHAITPTLPVRTMGGGGGFYSTGWGRLPWGWSREPADVIVVTRYD